MPKTIEKMHAGENQMKKETMAAYAKARVSIKTIDPAQAKQILSKGNAWNRDVSPKYAQHLATKMTNGEWLFNGASIVLNDEEILDGQHRLQAIILSGMTQQFVVVEGVETKAFKTFDIGKKRDFATMLSIDSENNPKDLATAVNWLIKYNLGFGQQTDIEEKYAWLNNHPTIREEVALYVETRGQLKGVSIGCLAATHHISKKVDEELARVFFLGLVTGEEATDNTELLRSFIAEIQEKKFDQKAVRIASAIRQVWNATRAGKTLENIKNSLDLASLR